jgi:alpha-beta hydrolase superfamily lysophospholipase
MNTSEEQPMKLASDSVTVFPGVKLYYELRSSPNESSRESLKMIMIMGAFATMKHFEEQAEFLVNHFSRSHIPIDILTYDHRGIGKSGSTSIIRQTSRMLAND